MGFIVLKQGRLTTKNSAQRALQREKRNQAKHRAKERKAATVVTAVEPIASAPIPTEAVQVAAPMDVDGGTGQSVAEEGAQALLGLGLGRDRGLSMSPPKPNAETKGGDGGEEDMELAEKKRKSQHPGSLSPGEDVDAKKMKMDEE